MKVRYIYIKYQLLTRNNKKKNQKQFSYSVNFDSTYLSVFVILEPGARGGWTRKEQKNHTKREFLQSHKRKHASIWNFRK